MRDRLPDPADRAECARFLAALFADASEGSFVEVRFRTATGMGRAFYGVAHVDEVATAIGHHSRSTDVYVGVLARRRQASRRDDLVHQAHVIWADCDTVESVAALAAFAPQPSIVVASGIIRSGRSRARCRCGVWGWRHVVSAVALAVGLS